MPQGDKGTLGTIEFYLSQNQGLSNFERYRRQLIPVEPASRQIPGSPDAVAPDTTIAQWSINDWNQGEGDVTWRDRGRYNVSTRLGPASDGSGLIAAPEFDTTQHDSGGGNFDQGQRVARAGAELLAGLDSNDNLYKWDETNSEWDNQWAIGGSSTGDVISIAAVNDTKVYVGLSGQTIREVQSASNAEHFAAWGSTPAQLTSYQGKLYGLDELDMYEISTVATDTRTLRGDVPGLIANYFNNDSRLLSTSDVGPIWTTSFNDGRSEIWEYNVADDSAYVVAELPRDATIYDVLFHEGIYFVGYRAAAKTGLAGDAFMFFASGGNRGSIGPFRAQSGTTVNKFVILTGVIGDRLMVFYDNRVHAYDLSTGGISVLTDANATAARRGVTFGKDIFINTNAAGLITRVNFAKFSTGNGTLDSGRFDFGYKGLRKMMTKVTIVCEVALTASDVISVSVAVDGGSFTALSGSMTSGDVTKTFIVATTSTNFEGFSFEIRLHLSAGATSATPKIISVDSEAIGVESRLEWIMAVDVTDRELVVGQTVLTGLETLRTAKAPIAFTNPFDDDVYATADSHTVTIEDVTFPQENAGGDDYVVVRVRATQTV